MEELDLKELFNVFWAKKMQIVMIIVVFAVIGFVYSYAFIEPIYQSTTSILLAKSNTEQSDSDTITSTEITLNQKLVSTYSELLKSETLLNQVIDNLQISKTTAELEDNITVSAKDDTEIIEISVTDPEPSMAQRIANEVAQVFITQVAQQYYNMDNVYVVDKAQLPEEPYNINHMKDLLVFAAVGFVISCVYVLIANMLDTTVKSKEDVENRIGLTVLTIIPECDFNKKKGGRR